MATSVIWSGKKIVLNGTLGCFVSLYHQSGMQVNLFCFSDLLFFCDITHSRSKCKSVLALVQKQIANCPTVHTLPLKALFLDTQNGGIVSKCSSTTRFTCNYKRNAKVYRQASSPAHVKNGEAPGTHCLRMRLISPRYRDSGVFSDSSVLCDVRVRTR